MQTFLFQITQRYVNLALKIVTPYWIEVTYEVVDNKVVVIDAKIPYEILTYLNGYHLGNDIYFAAENNYASMKAASNTVEVFSKIFDHFKMPVQ